MALDSEGLQDLRKKRRFNFEPPREAIFYGIAVRVLNLSEGGIQIEHDEPLKIGANGKLRFLGQLDGQRVEFRIRLLWSRVLQQSALRAGTTFQSGGRLEDPLEAIAGRLGMLIRTYGRLDTTSMQRKAEGRRAREEERRAGVERARQHELIGGARTFLSQDTEAAGRLFVRAAGAVPPDSDADGKLDASTRREVLAVWEYLERQVALETIIEEFAKR